MDTTQQYILLVGPAIGTVGVVISLYGLARSLGRTRREPGKDMPASAEVLWRNPVWVRYHARCFGYALLFLAFDKETA